MFLRIEVGSPGFQAVAGQTHEEWTGLCGFRASSGEGVAGLRGLDLPEQFQPVGVWQSLKEVGKAASFTGRAMISSVTGSSSSQQKPSQSVQLLHCRGDSHSTMTTSRNSAATSGF